MGHRAALSLPQPLMAFIFKHLVRLRLVDGDGPDGPAVRNHARTGSFRFPGTAASTSDLRRTRLGEPGRLASPPRTGPLRLFNEGGVSCVL